VDESTKRWLEEFERDDETWHEFRRRRLPDDEPIQKSVEKSRESS